MNKEEQWLLNEKYKGVESFAFHADLERLRTGEPLAYIIGSIPFLGCTIHLDTHPLIPRPETEFWVEEAIKTIQSTTLCESNPQILDLCAGSGAIGIAVAKAIPEVHVTFGEIDAKHMPIIAKNLEANGIDCTRYKVFASNLFENITGTYDFILTNPPYIDPAIDRAEASVKTHEPHLALYGGSDGMEIIEKIIAQATEHLKNTGQLWIEHEPEQKEAIAKHGIDSGFIVTTHTDQYQVPRYSVLRMAQ